MNDRAEANPPSPRGHLDDAAFNAVVEAAQLARRCDGYWQDRRDQSAGWTVHYAIDVDVIAMYSQPSHKLPYARIFAALDGTAVGQRMAELLGQFALLQLTGLGSDGHKPGALIVIPPHDDEYDRMRLAIMQQSLAQAETAVADLPALLDAITAGLGNDASALAKTVDGLIAEFGHVVEAFDGQSGPVRQLTRLAALSKRLLNLHRAPPYLRERRDERLLPLVEGRDAPDRAAHFELIRQWRARLERHRPRNKPAYALMADATALATLQMVNERAAPAMQRLVLITGSPYVMAAAADAEVVIGGNRTSFERAYLRHPQAFIGAKAFFERDTAVAESDDKHRSRLRIVDWLNLFFPKVLLQTRPADPSSVDEEGMSHDANVRVDHLRLDAIIKRDDKWLNATLGQLARDNYRRLTHREFPDGLLDDFKLQIEQIATDLGVSVEDSRMTRFRALQFVEAVNLRLGSGFTVADLQTELASRIEDTVFKLYLETGELGVMQLLSNGDPVRGVPALHFDGTYRAAQEQSELLCLTLWREHARVFDLGAAYTALDSDGDPEHYHAHLIHAQVYAARGHWFAVRTLSRLALRVSDRIPEPLRRGRRGREAAYLMAVAERRLAQKPDDLQRAEAALSLARDKETPGREPVDPRFRAEALALQVTRLQFQRFHTGAAPGYPLAHALEQAESIFNDLTAQDPQSVRSWVRRQVTTNVLVLALLCEIDRVDRPDGRQRDAVLELMAGFRAEHLAPDSMPDANKIVFRDGLSSFVYDVAVVAFVADLERRAASFARLTDDAPLGLGVPPFESARKDLFRTFVAERRPSLAAQRG